MAANKEDDLKSESKQVSQLLGGSDVLMVAKPIRPQGGIVLNDYSYPNFVKLFLIGEIFFHVCNSVHFLTLTKVLPDFLRIGLVQMGAGLYISFPLSTIIMAYFADSITGILFVFRITAAMILALDVSCILSTFNFILASNHYAKIHLSLIMCSHAWRSVRLSLLMKQYQPYSVSNARRFVVLYTCSTLAGEGIFYAVQHFSERAYNLGVIIACSVEILHVIAFVICVESIEHLKLLEQRFHRFCLEKYFLYAVCSTYYYIKHFNPGRSWFGYQEQVRFFSKETALSANNSMKTFIVFLLSGSIAFVLCVVNAFVHNDFLFLSDSFVAKTIDLDFVNRIYGIFFIVILEFFVWTPLNARGKHAPVYSYIVFGYVSTMVVLSFCIIQSEFVNIATIPTAASDKAQLTIFNGLSSSTYIVMPDLDDPAIVGPFGFHHIVDIDTNYELTLSFYNLKSTLHFTKTFKFSEPISYRFVVTVSGLADTTYELDANIFKKQGFVESQVRLLDAFDLCTWGSFILHSKKASSPLITLNNSLTSVILIQPGLYTPRVEIAGEKFALKKVRLNRNGRYFLILNSLLKPQMNVIDLMKDRSLKDWIGYVIIIIQTPADVVIRGYIIISIYMIAPDTCKTIFLGMYSYTLYVAITIGQFSEEKTSKSLKVYYHAWLYVAITLLATVYILIRHPGTWRATVPLSKTL